jgi:environmental stress-induced protein Ves
VRILRTEDYRVTPWKNGGGETAEIATGPEGAGLDRFDWRVSMATVASDGPFSRFDGIDRTLTVLDGAGLALAIGDGARVVLTPASDPLSFAGDAPAAATLVGGAVHDFNVMTRRGRYRHDVRRIQVRNGQNIPIAATDFTLLFCCAGELEVGALGAIGPFDAALVSVPASLAVSGSGSMLVARIWPDAA